MDHTIHQSFWANSLDPRPLRTLSPPLAVDVAIVGGGITGLTAALMLKSAGKSVALIEAGEIGKSETTSYSSAHLTEYLDVSYADLIRQFGRDTAVKIAQSTRNAIAFIEAISKLPHFDCQFERVNGYYYAEKAEDINDIAEEFEAAKSLGLDVHITNEVPLPFETKTGVCFQHQAQFHPARYLAGLLSNFLNIGGQVLEKTRVLSVDRDQVCTVVTDKGIIMAASVIIATHTPINTSLIPFELEAFRSYLIAVRPNDNQLLANGLFWDTEDPYHYIRQIKDDKGVLLLIGGEDHKTGQETDTEVCFNNLENYARAHFPISSIDYKWSSQYYNSPDDLPYIGRLNNTSNLYVGTGFSGNGLTFGTVAGLLISDLILNKYNEFAEVYNPNRTKSISAIGKLVSTGINVAAQFIGDRIKPAETISVEDIGLEEGKLLDINGQKTAVYKDAEGTLHAMSPICTHAGCVVNWNEAEKSWDCPCHGGRFDCHGNVLNGPPTKSLEKRLVEITQKII
jgi:glycine/D-amino acid oxidase-like deaminating enzyme/nitrite reductase/ring-hydroxylating ferredoxin subunit